MHPLTHSLTNSLTYP
uniref:Uncharacterized protein n=1 Tax=Anguilla anguilla TaxID=7936 RepID=A0A0E9RNE5_ANGAN